MTIKRYGWILVLLLSTMQCIDPITLQLKNESQEQLVIYGRITDLDESNYVLIQRSINDANQPRTVSGASVTVTDEDLNQYTFDELRPGYYELSSGVARQPGKTYTQPGKTYTLEVTLLNGTTYQSKPETMPVSIGSDSIYYEISKDSYVSKDNSRILHLLYVYTKTKLPATNNYYLRWETDEVYYWNLTNFPDPFNTPAPDCIAEDRVDPQRINLFNGTNVTAASATQFIAEREIDYSFLNRHYMIVRQFSTTEASHEYYKNINTVMNNSGSPFDVPPAAILSNITNINNPDEIVLGYFEACRQTNQRFFLVPGFIPYYIEQLCPYLDGKPFEKYDKRCLDCSQLPNSSNIIPPWF